MKFIKLPNILVQIKFYFILIIIIKIRKHHLNSIIQHYIKRLLLIQWQLLYYLSYKRQYDYI